MAKVIVTIEFDNNKDADRAVKYGTEEFSNLFCGMDNGCVDAHIVSVEIDEPPVAAVVADEGVVRAYTSVSSVGALRRFLDGIPDSAGLESYSGSVESLVNFGLTYGESYDEYSRDAGKYVLTINNEN